MKTRTITFPTNINGKLSNEAIVHIDLAPRGPVPESLVDQTVVEIRTLDNSFPPTRWKLWSLLRLKLHEVTSIHSMPSHGLPGFEFCKQLMSLYQELKTTSEVAIYYYQKIKE